jgi:glycogen debranching enzyme
LRRAAICWGDSVKLRYGSKPSDNPILWEYMSKYVRDIASIFDGVRLDNAHNTPLHVAKYLLNEARSANPNIFVMAEFFSNSKESECKYVQELGINTLIREL